MALVINDRVKETTTTTGTGTVTLGGAVSGFETFAAGIGNSNTTYYCIVLNAEFEVGLGTLSSDSSTLARTTIISSSNSDSAVDFSAGSKFVFCCLPASKTTILDANNNLTLPAKLIMPDVTSGKILVADGTSYEEVALSGDATIASGGALTIANDAVEQAMIADDAVGADQLAASAVVTASIVDDNVTQAKIADDAVGADQLAANAVVNASVASDAAIADTKLATISTANKVDIGALDIDGASDIGAALADADLIIVDDGASGTEKKCEVSRIKTYIADVTLTTAAQTNITSLGTLTTLTVDNIIINGTNIGHTSDTDSIAIASDGVVTFSQRDVHSGGITIADGGQIGSASDTDAIAIGSDGDVTLTQDLELQHDGAILSFGANDEIALTHVHDTGLLLTDSGGTPTLQFHDANESFASDGSKIIMTSGGTAFNMPTADGSDGHFLKTNGSGTLSFAAASASSLACDDLTEGDAAVTISTSSGNITIDATANDSDIIFKGTDGGSDTTFLTIDGSAAGAATFNDKIIATELDISGDIDVDGTANLDVVDIDGAVDMASTLGVSGVVTANAGVVIDNITIDGTEIDLSSGDLTLDVAGDIVLDAGGDEVIFKDGSTNVGHISLDSDNLTIKSLVSDKDMIFQGNDGGSGITALTLDMSAAGAATFNNDVTAFSDNRFKEDIETIPDGLSKVCKLRGVTYNRIDIENYGDRHMGVIAQEVEKIIPEVVKTDKSKEKIKSVAYGNMVGLLIEAIKDLKNEVDELKNRS